MMVLFKPLVYKINIGEGEKELPHSGNIGNAAKAEQVLSDHWVGLKG